jgi:type I restriction enzyme R subunit
VPVPNFISEDQIERALVQKLQHLHGFDSLDCHTEDPEDLNDGSGRANKREVILVDRVREAATRLNPDIPANAIEEALEKLLDRRQSMSLVAANQEVYGLLRDGIPVEFDDAQGRPQKERVYLIEFDNPDANRYLAVTQLWVKGDRGFRRPDVLLYVNGLPLVFIELKNSNVKLRNAFDDNLTNYKREIPRLFLTNAFCVLSNAIETKVGSITAEWEHFFVWLRAEDEKEKIDREEIARKGTSLEGVIAGLFPRQRLLDYMENFILYYKDRDKIVAQNHQFLGVNRAFALFVAKRSTLTPALSQGEREKEESPQYRGGYYFEGQVERARELRQKQTPAEELLWELLRDRRFLELKFRRQHQIGDHIVDFYCHEHRLVIEADGEVHETSVQKVHDEQRDAILRGQGFQVIRFSNQQILENAQEVLQSIADLFPSSNGRGARGEGKTPANGLGVFWHTQGSGKSFSMIFYARKIFRKETGNFTFVVVTDRDDLDGQIYRNFLNTGTVTKAEAAQPKNSGELRKFLGQNKRLVFTLIQKFRWDKGKEYPLLSDRRDIIVIVDEAHRTQYKDLAENMRAGLKNAQYLAFTGTPLLGAQRKTNAWFGDYVSEYNFQQSMDDGATVPLFYKKRVPRVLIQNDDLADDLAEICEDENLDEAQQQKLENRFAQEIEVIKRDDRLETIAEDIVYHFPRRGYLGKGMVVSLDKFTAVKMYDKVQRLWKERIKELNGEINKASTEQERERLKKLRDHMKTVEMAVVVSEEADEETKFAKQKLDTKPHRERMNRLDEHGHDIEHNFKNPEHPLQLVFVCAMWLTGFDAPTLSTLYLDKPMKDHTLMQTIARANRVTSWKINGKEKKNGEIVDYYNVFRNMRKALKDYAQGQTGEEVPVREKDDLFRLLNDAIEQGTTFCAGIGIDLSALHDSKDIFKKVEKFKQHANTMLAKDEWRKSFSVYENTITGLYEACKPEILGKPIVRSVAVFQYLRGVVDAIIEQANVDAVSLRIGELLDESLVVDESTGLKEDSERVRITQTGKAWDLSKINFEKLKEDFKTKPHKNIEIADLRAFIQKKLEQMMKENVTRTDFATRLQGIVDRYNAGSSSADNYFEELMKFAKEMKSESERHVREGLTEDELELFDLIKKDKMTKEEEQKVRLAAKSLLNRLRNEPPKVLVQDWFKDGQSQKQVRSAVEAVLDEKLPETYDRALFTAKCNSVFETMLNYASQGLKWAA